MNTYLTSQERRLIIGIVLVLATGTIVRYHARHKSSGETPTAPATTLNHDAETRF
jgi:hypothetical protein